MAGGVASHGAFQGENPLDYALPLVILQICLVIVVTRGLAYLLRPLRQPRVIAEIIGGILLGPSALGRSTKFLDAVFPERSMTVLDTLANLGLLFFLFLVGLELDLNAIRRTGKKALAISLSGIAVPFVFGIGTSFVFRSSVPDLEDSPKAPFLVFMGVALSIAAFPVLARILTELKLLTTDLGRMAMSAAAVDDVTAWILLALAIALSGNGSPIISLWVLLTAIGFVAAVFVLLRPVLAWMARRSPDGEPVKEVYVVATLAIVLAAGFVTDVIGIHALFGAFMVGIVVPKDEQFAGVLIEKVEELISGLFLPLYFVSSGLKDQRGHHQRSQVVGPPRARHRQRLRRQDRRRRRHMPPRQDPVPGGHHYRLPHEHQGPRGARRAQHRQGPQGAQRRGLRHHGAHGAIHHVHHHAHRHGGLQAGAAFLICAVQAPHHRRGRRRRPARARVLPRLPQHPLAPQPRRALARHRRAPQTRRLRHAPRRALRALLRHLHGAPHAPQRHALLQQQQDVVHHGGGLRGVPAAQHRQGAPHDGHLRHRDHTPRHHRQRRQQARRRRHRAVPQDAPARRHLPDARLAVPRRQQTRAPGGALLRRHPRRPWPRRPLPGRRPERGLLRRHALLRWARRPGGSGLRGAHGRAPGHHRHRLTLPAQPPYSPGGGGRRRRRGSGRGVQGQGRWRGSRRRRVRAVRGEGGAEQGGGGGGHPIAVQVQRVRGGEDAADGTAGGERRRARPRGQLPCVAGVQDVCVGAGHQEVRPDDEPEEHEVRPEGETTGGD